MKLPIRKEYFDLIKAGKKRLEYRDAHITFVCEETGETLTKDVSDVALVSIDGLPSNYKDSGLFDDDTIIVFDIR